MKLKILIFAVAFILIGCESDDKSVSEQEQQSNQILMLKVDYTTNEFEGGKEFDFPQQSESFTITNEYVEPGDFGSVKLIYDEIDEQLFFGTIHWMGLGEMTVPANIQPPSDFEVTVTADYVFPAEGYKNVIDPQDLQGENYDYSEVWGAVQSLVKARAYLESNPNQKVKIFLYTPSVGLGNPEDWDWIIYMKK
jgi:hypothetical protein